MIRIWLDDIRPMPEGFTHWCKRAADIKPLMETGEVSHISFDHDLGEGGGQMTGYHAACFIENRAYSRKLPRLTWDIHSANPVGRKNIEVAMRKAEEYWSAWELDDVGDHLSEQWKG